MIDYDEALKIVLEQAPGPAGKVQVPLGIAAGRVLGSDVVAKSDLPPFDKAAMDGFAVRVADVAEVPATLDVVMDVPAGAIPSGPIGAGQTASVMTGAPVPPGADAVIQVEWTSGFGGDTVEINQGIKAGKNISPRGEIIRAGDVVLTAGTTICVEETSLLAAAGCDPVPVFALPSAAVLSTGDEVVPAGDDPGPGQIRDSNGPAIAAFLGSLGIAPTILDPASDDPSSLGPAIEKGLEHDCLLVTGGVSAGAYDFVTDVLEQLGVEVHTRKVAIKPGKPTVFGTRGDKMIFGLPGNPVSAIVICRALVEPALRKRKGCHRLVPRTVKARLLNRISKKPNRLWLVHGNLGLGEECTVEALSNRGSADLPAAARGDCLIVAPRGTDTIEQGEVVDVVVWNRCL
jgi:molybdopterin molybdotransferase